jgi:hypothetical protein
MCRRAWTSSMSQRLLKCFSIKRRRVRSLDRARWLRLVGKLGCDVPIRIVVILRMGSIDSRDRRRSILRCRRMTGKCRRRRRRRLHGRLHRRGVSLSRLAVAACAVVMRHGLRWVMLHLLLRNGLRRCRGRRPCWRLRVFDAVVPGMVLLRGWILWHESV